MELHKLSVDKLDGVIVKNLAEESVILNLNSSSYYGLDSIGRFFWDTAMNTSNVSSALELITEKYDIDREVIKADFLSLLDQLKSAGLICLVQENS